MPKLSVFSGNALCRLLEAHGFIGIRQRGSHRVMQKRTSEGSITVPVPLHDEIRIGTLLSIIRQSGLPRALFEVGQ